MYNYTRKLSENFTLGEMVGMRADNIPECDETINLVILTQRVLQPLRSVFGAIRINSGFRSKEYNAKVGGVATSQHTKGQAADIVPLSADIENVFKAIVKGMEYDQCIMEDNGYSKWIHVSYNLGNNRKQAMTAIVDKTGTHYSKWEDK